MRTTRTVHTLASEAPLQGQLALQAQYTSQCYLNMHTIQEQLALTKLVVLLPLRGKPRRIPRLVPPQLLLKIACFALG